VFVVVPQQTSGGLQSGFGAPHAGGPDPREPALFEGASTADAVVVTVNVTVPGVSAVLLDADGSAVVLDADVALVELVVKATTVEIAG
jgi:hypothetical protein